MTDPAGWAQPPRVVIADDQALVRGGFRLILDTAGIPVVAEAADGRQAIAAVLRHRPDVVLMDIRMPVMDGLQATRRIVESRPGTDVRVIMLTTFDLDQYVYASLAAGASGFLLKDLTRTPDRRRPAGTHRRRAAGPVHHPAPGRALRAPAGRTRPRRPGPVRAHSPRA
jgi:CheY-like chemotaxis protein